MSQPGNNTRTHFQSWLIGSSVLAALAACGVEVVGRDPGTADRGQCPPAGAGGGAQRAGAVTIVVKSLHHGLPTLRYEAWGS